MKQKNKKQKLFQTGLGCAIILLLVQSLGATTHTVQFGGSHGFAYSPTAFTAEVGDTVMWQGDFSVHPLSSTTIPATATSWHSGTGSSFSYVIKVAGSYNYKCDVHVSLGMVGTFVATESAVISKFTNTSLQTQDLSLEALNASGIVTIKFGTKQSRSLKLQVFDIAGKELGTIFNNRVLPGSYSVGLGSIAKAKGFYFIKLSSVDAQRVALVFNAN